MAEPILNTSNEKSPQIFPFASWLNQFAEAVYVTNAKGYYVYANKMGAQRYGTTPENLVGQHVSKYSKLFNKEYTWEIHFEKIRSQKSVKLETIHLDHNQKQIYVEVSVNLVEHEGVEYAIAFAHDITQRRENETKLLRNEQLLQEIYHKAVEAILLIDVKNKLIVDCNERALKLFEFPSKEFLIGTDGMHLLKEKRPAGHVFDPTKGILEKGFWSSEIEYITHTGKPFWGHVQVFLITLDQDQFLLIKIKDITSGKKTEQLLQKNERQLRTMIEYTKVLICTHDMNGKIISVNPASLKAVEYTEEEIIGKPLKKIFEEKNYPLYDQYLKKVTTNGQDSGIMAVMSKSGKRMYWIYQNMKITEEGGDPYIVGYAQDITDRMMMERELLKQKKIAEDSVKARDTFVATMSHEMRTPLNGILGVTNLLGKTSLEIKQRDYLNIIQNSADNLLMIINDVLDIAKIESGHMELEEIPFNIKDSLDTTLESFTIKANEKNIKLIKDLRAIEQANLLGDPTRINQIVSNLVSNAIKFTDSGYVKVKAATSKLSSTSITLQITVEDTGIGVPLEKQEMIFDEFTQSHASTTRKYGGTGLGLAICKKISKLMKGDVTLLSIPDQGSTFTLSLPLKISSEKNISSNATQAITIDLHNISILLAEDNEVNQYITRSILVEYGCTVDIAYNGFGVLDLLNKGNYDLILMDVQMPDMDGIEATKLIRESSGPNKNVPIIALTANAMKKDKESYLSIGMNNYLSKPFKEHDLLIAIGNTLGLSFSKSKIKRRENKEEKQGALYSLNHLSLLTLGNKVIIEEMIRIFLRTTPEELKNIKLHLKEKDFKKVKLNVHKLKSGLKTFEIANIEKDIREIEGFDEARSFEDFKLITNRFVSFVQIVVNQMLSDYSEVLNKKSS